MDTNEYNDEARMPNAEGMTNVESSGRYDMDPT
jgi:hypothetical protein